MGVLAVGGDLHVNLLCALCFYTRDVPEPAITVISGYATCDDHASYFQDFTLSHLITQVSKNEGRG